MPCMSTVDGFEGVGQKATVQSLGVRFLCNEISYRTNNSTRQLDSLAYGHFPDNHDMKRTRTLMHAGAICHAHWARGMLSLSLSLSHFL